MKGRKTQGPATLDPGSLLRVPLVARLVDGVEATLVPRAVDHHWYYERIVTLKIGGFNPFAGQIFHGARSRLATWLQAPHRSGRPLNERDELVNEVLFAAHDYLHVWAYSVLGELCPELRIGEGPLREADFERLVFCHLLSEAVATVGLDFWYLGTVKLCEVCDLGTTVQTLTTSYHQEWEGEYRRGWPSVRVQVPAFFEQIAQFYCDGVLTGVDVEALRLSPRLLKWLEHELRYGVLQREYTRRWLSFLRDGKDPESTDEMRRPVKVAADWQRKVTRELGDRLWRLVKEGTPARGAAPSWPTRAWCSPAAALPDPRFTTISGMSDDEIRARSAFFEQQAIYPYFFAQFVSAFRWDKFDRGKLPLLSLVKQHPDVRALLSLFRGETRLAPCPGEPRDLLFLN